MGHIYNILYLDRFFRWTWPLLNILSLFVLFAARWQVGVVSQSAEQRGNHGTGIHLFLQCSTNIGKVQLKSIYSHISLIITIKDSNLYYRAVKSAPTSNRAMLLPSYCWLLSMLVAALLLMKGLLSLGFPSPETQKSQLAQSKSNLKSC